MPGTQTYRNLTFTKHAWNRALERSISAHAIWETLNQPAKKFVDQAEQTTKFIKTVGERRLHVVASYLHDERQWLVISVWVRGEGDKPPFGWRVITAPFRLVWWLLKQLLG